MSNFDDSAARRDRRAREERQDWRSQPASERDDRRPQSSQRDYDDRYIEPRPSDRNPDPRHNPRPQNNFSGFSRHQYEPPQAEPAAPPPRFEQAPPTRDYDIPPPPPPPSYPAQPQREQFNRYQEPQAYVPPPPPPAETPQTGYYAERHELYDRESAQDRPNNPAFGNQRLYEQPGQDYRGNDRHEDYDQNRRTLIDTAARSPSAPLEDFPHLARNAPSAQDEYERNFAARLAAQAQEPPVTSRFYLPQDPVSPGRNDQAFDDGRRARFDQGYDEKPNAQPARYGQDGYLSRPSHDTGWDADAFDQGGGHNQIMPYGDGRSPLDEDYFADEDEPIEQAFAPRKSRKMLIAASLGGALIVGGGGAYLYKSMRGGGFDQASAVIPADTRPTKDFPADAGGRQFPNGNKAIYKRLTEDGTEVNAAASPVPAVADKPASAPGSSLEDRIDEALKKAQRPGGADQPTVVRSETYRPDGTKLGDSGNRFVVAGSGSAAQGQLPAPFGASPAPGSPQAAQGQFTVTPLAPAPQRAQFAPTQAPSSRVASAAPVAKPAPVAAPQSSLVNGYFAQLGASQDEKLAANQLSSLSEKYSSVLGKTAVSTKTVDLGAKGVWFRTVAGPLDSAEAAADLCKQLKAAGQKDCIVKKPE